MQLLNFHPNILSSIGSNSRLWQSRELIGRTLSVTIECSFDEYMAFPQFGIQFIF